MAQVPSSLVSVDWLYNHLDDPNVVVLNATLGKPNTSGNSIAEYQIPKTRFFDIKNKFSKVEAPFPNTFPSKETFTLEARTLGIDNDSCIVVFDEKGIYSSARVWWMFKAFGFNNIAVLDGGLPAWERAGYPTEIYHEYSGNLGDFTPINDIKSMKFFDDMQDIVKSNNYVILDARSEKRFYGMDSEPRAGLRSGHIPSSLSLPFTSLLSEGKFKPMEEVKHEFNKLTTQDKPIVFSCGSGITACVLALGAELSGYENLFVYDGSWTEWGTLTTS